MRPVCENRSVSFDYARETQRAPLRLSSPDSCLILIPEYKAVYKQRTADERSHSQAVAIGSERPKLRRQSAIANQNTLIYVLINLRALQRVRTTKEQLAHQPKLPG
jgi:hypothetical protein